MKGGGQNLWNAIAIWGIPAPRGCLCLPQSSWQPFGDTNEPTKLWKHAETPESAVFWRTVGRTSTSENPCSQVDSSSTVWHLSQAVIFAVP